MRTRDGTEAPPVKQPPISCEPVQDVAGAIRETLCYLEAELSAAAAGDHALVVVPKIWCYGDYSRRGITHDPRRLPTMAPLSYFLISDDHKAAAFATEEHCGGEGGADMRAAVGHDDAMLTISRTSLSGRGGGGDEGEDEEEDEAAAMDDDNDDYGKDADAGRSGDGQCHSRRRARVSQAVELLIVKSALDWKVLSPPRSRARLRCALRVLGHVRAQHACSAFPATLTNTVSQSCLVCWHGEHVCSALHAGGARPCKCGPRADE